MLLGHQQSHSILISFFFCRIPGVREIEALRVMEKDVRDFVEECEPQLIITLPQAGQLNERMSVEPSGRPMNPQASYSGDQGKGNAAIAQMSLRLADGFGRFPNEEIGRASCRERV